MTTRWAMAVDTVRCVGCAACVIACKTENRVPNGGFRDWIVQDVRGRYGSEGEFIHVRPFRPVKSGPQDIDENTDTYDTIDWLVKHVANNNGKVGMYGISYPGFYTAAGLIDDCGRRPHDQRRIHRFIGTARTR